MTKFLIVILVLLVVVANYKDFKAGSKELYTDITE